MLQLDFPSRTGISFYNRRTACFRRAISLFLRKQSGGWQQQGVSLENNKHQNRKISNLVVLQQKSALHVNWIVTERLISFFFFPSSKVASLHFRRSLSVLFSVVSLLCLCVCKWKDTHSCSSSSRLLSALPCLTHFVCHWSRRRAFPACEGKNPLCSFCCHGKVDQARDSFSTTTGFQFSYINNISDIPTITHLIQTALEAGWWRIAESCQHTLE